jgi:hypothetical protein
MAKKQKLPEITSPIGVWKWPKLHEPDYGTDEYPVPEGQYALKLVLKADDKETKAFLKSIEPHYKAAIAEGEEKFKELPVAQRKKLKKISLNEFYSQVYDVETEEPTGEIEFNVKMKASGEYKRGPKQGEKWHRKPIIFDAEGKRIKDIPQLFSGTEGRVRVALLPYFVAANGAVGLSLKLVGIQLIEPNFDGGDSADAMGFGAVEGGYAHEDTDVDPPSSEQPFEEAEEDDGDF